ncbi:MAG: cell division protein FtsQ/DivIB [Pseudomonadota bacterium]|nr:cell division protein FtsQ/DivIB [Pseudomonadota bacterium]
MRNNLIFAMVIIFSAFLIKYSFEKNGFDKIFLAKKIHEIKLENNKYLSKNFIFRKIDIREGQIFWFFKPFQLKKQLSSLKEIKNFKFYLDPNGVLLIIIEEVKPFMKWINKGHKNYIDEAGNVLKINYQDLSSSLIELHGSQANKNINSLNKVLIKYQTFLRKITKIFFQNNVGWQIFLDDSTCLYLPLKKLDKLVNIFENIRKSELYENYRSFDMRVIGRVYMNETEC